MKFTTALLLALALLPARAEEPVTLAPSWEGVASYTRSLKLNYQMRGGSGKEDSDRWEVEEATTTVKAAAGGHLQEWERKFTKHELFSFFKAKPLPGENNGFTVKFSRKDEGPVSSEVLVRPDGKAETAENTRDSLKAEAVDEPIREFWPDKAVTAGATWKLEAKAAKDVQGWFGGSWLPAGSLDATAKLTSLGKTSFVIKVTGTFKGSDFHATPNGGSVGLGYKSSTGEFSVELAYDHGRPKTIKGSALVTYTLDKPEEKKHLVKTISATTSITYSYK